MSSASPPAAQRKFPLVPLLLLAALIGGIWFWREHNASPPVKKGPGPVPVTSTRVSVGDLPVRLVANGTVSAVQSVEVRAQISATVRAVQVSEGQFVKAGDRLFSLDTRTEEANLGKAEAQLRKSRADLANAERNLKRQQELFAQQFISQTALDNSQNQVDSLRAQVGADQAAVEASRVARGYGDIVAPIAGRVGAVNVYPGSLVLPTGAALLTITQIDPINISFTLPERELALLRQAAASREIPVTARLENGTGLTRTGQLAFIDNAVDSGSGTIRLKARFANPDGLLWPGMFVTVDLAPRTLTAALSVPVEAVQTGPERKFLYVIHDDNKVAAAPVKVQLVQEGRAVIEGVAAGTRIVVEGAQNLRPGSQVTEGATDRAPQEASSQQRKQPAS